MRQFKAFVKKEVYHIIRDRRTLFVLLGIPIVLIVLFGFALTNEVKNAKFAVLDHAKDIASRAIIDEMSASQYFDLTKNVSSYKQIELEIRQGNIKLVVVFPSQFENDLKHFSRAQVQIIADASDPNVANTLTNYASAIILSYQDRINSGKKLPYNIQTETRMLYNPQLKGTYTFVPGVMAMVLMLVCTMMTAVTIVREKETGTIEVLLASPIQPLKIILAKAIPYFLLSTINIASVLILSVWILDVPIKGNIILLIGESLLFIVTCLSLGLLISSSTASQQTAMFTSLAGMFLPTVMLSGFMFPIENMPLPLQLVSNIVPAKWFYIIVRSIMIKGVGFLSVLKETLILIAMTLTLLLVSIKKFKIRLE